MVSVLQLGPSDETWQEAKGECMHSQCRQFQRQEQLQWIRCQAVLHQLQRGVAGPELSVCFLLAGSSHMFCEMASMSATDCVTKLHVCEMNRRMPAMLC